MESPVDESRQSRRRGVDALLGEKDRVAGGFGELLDTGSALAGVTVGGNLKLACPADGSGDDLTGVDPDADSQFSAESIGNEALNPHSGGHGGVGMIGKGVRRSDNRQCGISERL